MTETNFPYNTTDTTVQSDNELKEQVRRYWNAHPCGTQFSSTRWGTKEFFAEAERIRYSTQPFMHELAEFEQFSGKELLEIGCGIGTDLLQFARGGAHVIGIDLTAQSIELVQVRFSHQGFPVRALVADAEQLPFPDNSFDVVYSFGVLHHTPYTGQAIAEVYRVLKPGGKIIIMLYHKHSLHVYLGVPLYWLLSKVRNKTFSVVEDWIRVYDGDENPLGKAYSRSEILKMMKQFSNITTSVYDPIRRRLPKMLNAINQKLFARWLGFWIVMKGEK